MVMSQTFAWTAAATVISMASMAGGYVTSQVIGPEHRMTALEVKEEAHEKSDEQWKAEIKDYRISLDNKLDRIDQKIDRLIERDRGTNESVRRADVRR